MTIKDRLLRALANEDINFLLTNRIPRRTLTRFVGWFSQIEQPVIRDFSLAVWRFFSGLDTSEAKKTAFRSMHDCFTRELKEGARPLDKRSNIMTSPCDAIIGAFGRIEGTKLYQIKGFPYSLKDLLHDDALVETYRNGCFVTLRLTSSMYHRFHAPHDCSVHKVTYISGDTWNVNPIALKRIEKLFCKNERAIIETRLASGQPVTLVPVAAILVASIRLHFLDVLLSLKHKGANVFACDARFAKGQEMGWFQHGSTIIVFAPVGFALCENIRDGEPTRVGQPLMLLPQT